MLVTGAIKAGIPQYFEEIQIDYGRRGAAVEFDSPLYNSAREELHAYKSQIKNYYLISVYHPARAGKGTRMKFAFLPV